MILAPSWFLRLLQEFDPRLTCWRELRVGKWAIGRRFQPPRFKLIRTGPGDEDFQRQEVALFVGWVVDGQGNPAPLSSGVIDALRARDMHVAGRGGKERGQAIIAGAAREEQKVETEASEWSRDVAQSALNVKNPFLDLGEKP